MNSIIHGHLLMYTIGVPPAPYPFRGYPVLVLAGGWDGVGWRVPCPGNGEDGTGVPCPSPGQVPPPLPAVWWTDKQQTKNITLPRTAYASGKASLTPDSHIETGQRFPRSGFVPYCASIFSIVWLLQLFYNKNLKIDAPGRIMWITYF